MRFYIRETLIAIFYTFITIAVVQALAAIFKM